MKKIVFEKVIYNLFTSDVTLSFQLPGGGGQTSLAVKNPQLSGIVNIVPDDIKSQSQRRYRIIDVCEGKTNGKNCIFLSQQLTAFRFEVSGCDFAAQIKIYGTKYQ